MSAAELQAVPPRPGDSFDHEQAGDVINDSPLPVLGDISDKEKDKGLVARLGLDTAHEPQAPRLDAWELQAKGDEAYDAARERERTQGLDGETVALYKESTDSYLRATWWAPKGSEWVADNPRTDIRMARSFAKQAKATPPGRFYKDGGNFIDERSNLQDLALKSQQRGIAGIMKGRLQSLARETSAEKDSTAVNPLIARAAIRAAVEAGTGEHVTVRGIGPVNQHTQERLEAQGSEGITQFTGVHGAEPDGGLEFIGNMVDNLETAIHDLPEPGEPRRPDGSVEPQLVA